MKQHPMLTSDALMEAVGLRVHEGSHLADLLARDLRTEGASTKKKAIPALLRHREKAVNQGAYLTALMCDTALRSLGYEGV